jgi:hypothetical protein
MKTGGITLGALLAPALYLFLIEPAQAQFVLTGSMNAPRAGQAAAALPDGRVLVAGGYAYGTEPSNPGDSAELYNPDSGKWTVTAFLNFPRAGGLSATLLTNGEVLVAGGYDGGSFPTNSAQLSTELYNPIAGTWTVTGPMNTARAQHTATLLPNGQVLVAGGVLGEYGDAVDNTAELYNPATGRWTVTGAMRFPRQGHTATLLANGKVLVAGGSTNAGAELYNPATGTWALTGSMSFARLYQSATLLTNGQVLIAGGRVDVDAALDIYAADTSAELYNPTNGTWIMTGAMNIPRSGHTATLLNNGQMLVAGGDAAGATAELYNPATGVWTLTGAMAYFDASSTDVPSGQVTATLLSGGLVLVAGGDDIGTAQLYFGYTGTWAVTGSISTELTGHTATLLPNGRVLAAGGEIGDPNLDPHDLAYTNGAELFDPTSGTWTLTGSMSTPRYLHSATLLLNGQALVAGGVSFGGSITNGAELYNPTNKAWAVTGSMNDARAGHTATLLQNGEVLVVGYDATGEAELYNPTNGTWSLTGSMTINRWGGTATLLPNGQVLVAGGLTYSPEISVTYNVVPFYSSAELYNPASGTWALTGPMNNPRSDHTATLLQNGQVLVGGGYSGDNLTQSPITDSELYDPVAGTWTVTGSMNIGRADHTASLLPNEEVLVAGGFGGYDGATAELYDPATGTWTFTSSLNTRRLGLTATVLRDGRVLAFGGYTNSAELYVDDLLPHLINQPADASSLPGANAAFAVIAAGVPPLAYQWLFNSGVIAEATNTGLTIGNAQITNTGAYQVVVGNAFGAVTSAVATLIVNDIIVNDIIVPPSNQIEISAPTNTIILRAGVGGSTPDTTYVWSTEGGEDQIVFTDSASPNTSVIFNFAGTYVLSVTATTGTNVVQARVTVTVGANPNGFFQNVASFLSGPLSTNGNVFLLKNFVSSSADASNYYAAIDPASLKTTLNNWKIANGVPTNQIPASATNFMNGVVAATYFNALDLGFGRRMIMRGTNGGDWAFAVSNYKTVDDAINDSNKIATVTMDYSAVPPGTARFTKFYVYNSNDARVASADLDGGGQKFVPGLCVVCHGGTTGAVPAGGGDVHAHFLAFDLLNALDYSSSSNLIRAAQEPAFKSMNQAVLAIEQDIGQNDPTNFSHAITDLIQGWYGHGLTNATENDNFIPSGWQDTNAAGSSAGLSLAGQAYLYRNVVALSCRSCHETRAGVSHDIIPPGSLDFGSFTNFNNLRGYISPDVFGTGTVGPDGFLNPLVAPCCFGKRAWGQKSRKISKLPGTGPRSAACISPCRRVAGLAGNSRGARGSAAGGLPGCVVGGSSNSRTD